MVKLLGRNIPGSSIRARTLGKTKDFPDYQFLDTLKSSRRAFGKHLPNHQLQTSAAACGFDLRRHHNALADAEACAAIAMKTMSLADLW